MKDVWSSGILTRPSSIAGCLDGGRKIVGGENPLFL